MVDTCVCCGTIVPEGVQICYKCANEDIYYCPTCKVPLKRTSSCRSATIKQIWYSRLYHCRCCGTDWEADTLTN